MSSRHLQDWLDYQLTTHPQSIALGLDRIREVASRMALPRPAPKVISVAGTNGKGSIVATCEAIARAAGLRVGCYTSPHLRRYNERVRIDGQEVSDGVLCEAFERVDLAREGVPLTYFEWGTLAALWVLAQAKLDLAVLEVGLGGRLDAVNLVDADVAVIGTVALDHMELLGNDRETIGREKAGIFRAGKLAVLSELDPPSSVLAAADRLKTRVLRRGRDFNAEPRLGGGWRYSAGAERFDLPAPALLASCQTSNAAAAITALRELFPIAPTAVAEGLGKIALAGRLQRLPGPVEIVLDVAHNPQAAQMLADWLLRNRPAGATHGVFAALADKDLPGLVAPMMASVDAWHLAGLPDVGGRAHPIELAWGKVAGLLSRSLVDRHETVAKALATARAQAAAGDRILVFGSFHTVGEALDALGA